MKQLFKCHISNSASLCKLFPLFVLQTMADGVIVSVTDLEEQQKMWLLDCRQFCMRVWKWHWNRGSREGNWKCGWMEEGINWDYDSRFMRYIPHIRETQDLILGSAVHQQPPLPLVALSISLDRAFKKWGLNGVFFWQISMSGAKAFASSFHKSVVSLALYTT